jgi:hypothetical protein
LDVTNASGLSSPARYQIHLLSSPRTTRDSSEKRILSNTSRINTELTCYLIESAMRKMHFDNSGHVVEGGESDVNWKISKRS